MELTRPKDRMILPSVFHLAVWHATEPPFSSAQDSAYPRVAQINVLQVIVGR